MTFIVHQAKLDLCNAIALVGEFVIHMLCATEVAFVISGIGFFERSRRGHFHGHQ